MSLLHPLYAGLLGLISVPIIIHLLNKRRYREVRWAAMEFLLEANRRNRRRVRIEHLLVLLLRCLAVALIALAIARPIVTDSGGILSFAAQAAPIERIVIVDDSASTRLRVGQQTVFDDARDHVRRLLEECAADRPADRITVVRASRPRSPDLFDAHAASKRTTDLLEVMEGWRPVDVPLRLPRVLDEVRAALDERESGEGRGGGGEEGADEGASPGDVSERRIVYVATDLRATDWSGADGDQGRAIAAALGALGAKALVVLDAAEDPAAADASNVGVVELTSLDTHVTTGVPMQLVARIRNHDRTKTARGLRLEMRAGSARLPARPLDPIPPGTTVTVSVQAEFTRAEPTAVEARIVEGDRLAADDARALALDVREALRVLVIDGTPENDLDAGESALYLLTALNPPGEARSGIAPDLVRPERLREIDLSLYDVILASDLPAWPAGQTAALEAFVRRGGGLLLLGGPNVDPAAWRRDLWREGAGVLPLPVTEVAEVTAEIGGEESASGERRYLRLLPPASTEHAALKVFGGEENPFLDRIRAYRFLAVDAEARPKRVGIDGVVEEAPEEPGGGEGEGEGDEDVSVASVVLTLADGARRPVLVERTFGGGRVALVTLAAVRSFTNWPREPSFPVFVWELVKHLAPSATARRNLAVGEPLAWPIDAARFDPRALVRGPDPDVGPLEVRAGTRPGGAEDAFWIETPPVFAAGVTTIELQERRGGEKVRLPFSFLLDPREGDLRRADPARIGPELEGLDVRYFSGDEQTVLEVTEGGRMELWRSLVLALAAVMLGESLLARHAAHHAKRTAE